MSDADETPILNAIAVFQAACQRHTPHWRAVQTIVLDSRVFRKLEQECQPFLVWQSTPARCLPPGVANVMGTRIESRDPVDLTGRSPGLPDVPGYESLDAIPSPDDSKPVREPNET